MNGESKAFSAVLLTFGAAFVTAVFSALNIFICMLTAWFMFVTLGIISIIEGVLLHLGSIKQDQLSEPVRFSCTYAPSMLISLFMYLAPHSDGFGQLVSVFYFWTAAGISAAGLIFSACIWFCKYMGKRRILKESKLPKIPYCTDQIDPEEFFNDNGE